VSICVTSQHRELLEQALDTFELQPGYDLEVMEFMQSPVGVLSKALPKLDRVLQEEGPDAVLVQGDTTSAFAGALAAFHNRIPVAHVEAGLRSGNFALPFPEEANRRMIAALAAIHFAPTERAARNLRDEGFPDESIVVTGNTVVDALHYILAKRTPAIAPAAESTDRKLMVVTLHRRETLGSGLEGLCLKLRALAQHHRDDIEIVFPVHKNPRVRASVLPVLSDLENVQLMEPVDYPTFIHLLERSTVVVTDSGGVQEEAAALGKAVLIAREVTERPEVLEAGFGQLIGTDPVKFEKAVESFLADPKLSRAEGATSVFGDGRAAGRIVSHLQDLTNSNRSVSKNAI
jgi:UDP-N-acetylglucosamine 2-epimerase